MASRLWALCFPSPRRTLPYNRVATIGFRTLHLLVSSVLLGGHAFDVAPDRLVGLLYLTVGSGVCLILLELYRSCDWVYQGMGVLVIAKVVITAAAGLWWERRVPLLFVVVVLGAVGSHMPARYRHYSLLHRRVVSDHVPEPPLPHP